MGCRGRLWLCVSFPFERDFCFASCETPALPEKPQRCTCCVTGAVLWCDLVDCGISLCLHPWIPPLNSTTRGATPPQATHVKYQRMLQRSFIELNSDVKWCPNPSGCDRAVKCVPLHAVQGGGGFSCSRVGCRGCHASSSSSFAPHMARVWDRTACCAPPWRGQVLRRAVRAAVHVRVRVLLHVPQGRPPPFGVLGVGRVGARLLRERGPGQCQVHDGQLQEVPPGVCGGSSR